MLYDGEPYCNHFYWSCARERLANADSASAWERPGKCLRLFEGLYILVQRRFRWFLLHELICLNSPERRLPFNIGLHKAYHSFHLLTQAGGAAFTAWFQL